MFANGRSEGSIYDMNQKGRLIKYYQFEFKIGS